MEPQSIYLMMAAVVFIVSLILIVKMSTEENK